MHYQLRDGRGVELRRAAGEDRELLLGYYTQFAQAPAPWYPRMPSGGEELQSWLTRGGYLEFTRNMHWIALSDAGVIGHLYVQRQDIPSIGLQGIGFINMSVAAGQRGLGLGALFARHWLATCEPELREVGFRRISGYILSENSAVMKLAERMGFQVEGLLRQHILGRDGLYHDVFLWARLLSEAQRCAGCETALEAQQAGLPETAYRR